jgi:hypothetical protein
MADVMKDYTEEEKRFAFYLFEFLKDRKIDEAQKISQDFFDSWPLHQTETKIIKSRPRSTSKTSQSNLGVFK